MIRIDFYGGSYGNFLEYIINRYVYNISFDIFSPFNQLGASHNVTDEYMNVRQVVAEHYSFKSGYPIYSDDTVIQIKINENSMYHVLYNSLMRAGDQTINLDQIEKNTIAKLTAAGKKFSNFKEQIIADYGFTVDYARSTIRNYFYSQLRESNFFLDVVNAHDNYDCIKIIKFDVGQFESIKSFIESLQKLSVELNNKQFIFDEDFSCLYNEFIDKNEGIKSYNKCNDIITDIISGKYVDINLTIIEEGFINCWITKTFNIHSDIDCFSDNYPTNTRIIYDQIIEKLK